MSLTLSVALMVMLLAIAGLAGAPAMVIPNAQAQYAANGQYGAGGQYAPSSQYSAVPSCQQQALNALSSSNLGSNSQTANRKLLSEFVKCGGTIASLPQESFTTLLRQGNIELDVVGSGWVACPRGDTTHCSAEPNFIG